MISWADIPVSDGNALSTVKTSTLSVLRPWISWTSCCDTTTNHGSLQERPWSTLISTLLWRTRLEWAHLACQGAVRQSAAPIWCQGFLQCQPLHPLDLWRAHQWLLLPTPLGCLFQLPPALSSNGPFCLLMPEQRLGSPLSPLMQLAPGGEGWNTSEAPCLNRCLWIYSSSVIKKKIIIGWFSFFFFFLSFFFFLTRTFHNSGDSLKNYLQVDYFMDKFFFSPSKFSFSSLKIKDKPASIPAAVFGWRFLPMLTIAPLPSHTLGGLYFTLFSRDYKNVASSREVGRKEEGRTQPIRAVHC